MTAIFESKKGIFRKCREQVGLSIEEAEKKLLLPIGAYENNEVKEISFRALDAMAALYGVPRWVFLCDEIPKAYDKVNYIFKHGLKLLKCPGACKTGTELDFFYRKKRNYRYMGYITCKECNFEGPFTFFIGRLRPIWNYYLVDEWNRYVSLQISLEKNIERLKEKEA